MSTVPMYLRDLWDDDVFDGPRRTARLFDQQFSSGLFSEEMHRLASNFHSSNFLRSSRFGSLRRSPGVASGDFGAPPKFTTLCAANQRLQITLDVQHFAPHEITVKTVGGTVVVEGKHDEKQDEHGYIARHFVRRYVLPDDHDPKDVISTLSSDGMLSIVSPRKAPPPAPAETVHERTIPVQRIEERTTESVRTTSESVTSESSPK
ncbi:protein lethal(2)essential for life-like [Anopheles cruzii]|uniref:protein lethal(2)essential for life-like n=1 Tax=Anopheles cruzii TaxID=68878 RepID=UPI0022EC6141|nr:protein lethal(2)essential for life-like [Anopheles cruzii]